MAKYQAYNPNATVNKAVLEELLNKEYLKKKKTLNVRSLASTRRVLEMTPQGITQIAPNEVVEVKVSNKIVKMIINGTLDTSPDPVFQELLYSTQATKKQVVSTPAPVVNEPQEDKKKAGADPE